MLWGYLVNDYSRRRRLPSCVHCVLARSAESLCKIPKRQNPCAMLHTAVLYAPRLMKRLNADVRCDDVKIPAAVPYTPC